MSHRYDREPSYEDEYDPNYDPNDADEVIDAELYDAQGNPQRYADEGYDVDYGEEDEAIAHRRSLDRREGFDLTSDRARLIATLLLIALGVAVILWAIRPGDDDSATTTGATAIATADAANAVVATITAGPTSTAPASEGGEVSGETGGETGSEGTAPTTSSLAVGGNAVVSGTDGLGVNLRESAGTGAAIIQILQDDQPLSVIGGPQEGEGYTWWQVQLEDGTQGWMVQEFLTAQ